MNDTLSMTQDVFRSVFDNPELAITAETHPAELPQWDSLTHIDIVLGLERAFGIEFKPEEIVSVGCVGDLMLAIKKHLK